MTEPTLDELPPARRLSLPLELGFWSFIAVLSAANGWLGAVDRGAPGPPRGLVPAAFLEAYLWAGVTLLVFHLCSRTSLEREGGVRAVLMLLALGLVVALAMETAMGNLRGWLQGPPPFRPGAPGPPPHPRPRDPGPVPGLTHLWFLNELITYTAIVAAGFAREYFLRYQARQAEASRLQAQTARLSAQLADARLAALRTQLDPHFLFNTLNAVSALVERDPEGVQRMIARLSELLRHTLDGSDRQEVPLEEEMGLVQRYLEIMEVRFQGRLTVTVDVDSALDHARVPSLILQPLVENAIKHGVSRRPGPGRIEISARRDGDRLVLRVHDDGDAPAGEPRDGVGLANTRERLRQLYGERQSLAVGPAPEGGFLAEVALPYHEGGEA
jgi:signal transduction histidine kinase